MKPQPSLLLTCIVFPLVLITRPAPAQQRPEDTAAQIRAEALRPNLAADGRPLPLWSSWNSETPATQMALVEQGHFVIPMFMNKMIRVNNGPWGTPFNEHFEKPIKRAKELGLPVGFITIGGTIDAHESLLKHPPFSELPPEKSALAYDGNGKLVDGKAIISPFGAIEPWRELGRQWADNQPMRTLQEWYPNPPLVVMLSNNEVGGLIWQEIGKDARCPAKARTTKDNDFKRQVIGDGWIERFRALQGEWKAGLTEPWRKAVRFIGYGANPAEFMGRFWGWEGFSLHTKDRVSPWPLAWDGGSPSYYGMTANQGRMPDGVWSPQVEFQSFAHLLPAMHQLNPDYWLEMSIWDGVFTEKRDANGKDHRERFYAAAGVTYTPQHLAGFAQFGMWLTRPRIARDFGLDSRPPFMQTMVEAVSRVHLDPALREWWRKGELVPNKTREHPYKFDFPKEWEKADRWFILDTSLDPKEPWTFGHDDPNAVESKFTRFAVFSIAFTRGQSGARQWLVYTYAPMSERKQVQIKIPRYRQITVDVPIAGAFYEVDERSGSVKLLPPPEQLTMLQPPAADALVVRAAPTAIELPKTGWTDWLAAQKQAGTLSSAFVPEGEGYRVKPTFSALIGPEMRDGAVRITYRMDSAKTVTAYLRTTPTTTPDMPFQVGYRVQHLKDVAQFGYRRFVPVSEGQVLLNKPFPATFDHAREHVMDFLMAGNEMSVSFNGEKLATVKHDELKQGCPGITIGEGAWVRKIEFISLDGVKGTEIPSPAASAPRSAPMPVNVAPPADPQLAALHTAWTARFDAEARKPFETAIATLNTSYLRALDTARAAAKNKGALNEVLAIDAEKELVKTSATVPAADAADTPPALATLRKTWRDTSARHATTRDGKLAQLQAQYAKALDALIIELTKANKIDEARRAQAFRDELAARNRR